MAGDIRTYLVDDILVKVDRMTMAHSLEARAPLLDHQLVEFAARLPSAPQARQAAGKRLLRQVAAPAATGGHPAQDASTAFPIPLARWFRERPEGARQRHAHSRASASAASSTRRPRWRTPIAMRPGRADHGDPLWLLLTFELWAQRFLDGTERVNFLDVMLIVLVDLRAQPAPLPAEPGLKGMNILNILLPITLLP